MISVTSSPLWALVSNCSSVIASGAETGLCLCQHLQCFMMVSVSLSLIFGSKFTRHSQVTNCSLTMVFLEMSFWRIENVCAIFLCVTIVTCHVLCHAAEGGGGASGFPRPGRAVRLAAGVTQRARLTGPPLATRTLSHVVRWSGIINNSITIKFLCLH